MAEGGAGLRPRGAFGGDGFDTKRPGEIVVDDGRGQFVAGSVGRGRISNPHAANILADRRGYRRGADRAVPVPADRFGSDQGDENFVKLRVSSCGFVVPALRKKPRNDTKKRESARTKAVEL